MFSDGVSPAQTSPYAAGAPRADPAAGLTDSAPAGVALQPTVGDHTPDRSCPLPACECPVCVPPGRFWVGVDYLLWGVRGDSLPPLVTTSPAGTARAGAGVLSSPGTVTLFGDSTANSDWRSGGRVQAGFWLDCEQRLRAAFVLDTGFQCQ